MTKKKKTTKDKGTKTKKTAPKREKETKKKSKIHLLLISVAKEMNEEMGLKPPINVKGTVTQLKNGIKDNAKDIVPQDPFSEETWKYLEKNKLASRRVEEPPKEKATKTKGKEETKKPAPKKTKQKSNGRPGVIKEIYSLVKKATKRNPITREEIHEHLVETFPERNAPSLLSTVKTQVPGRINREADFNLTKNKDGAFYKAR